MTTSASLGTTLQSLHTRLYSCHHETSCGPSGLFEGWSDSGAKTWLVPGNILDAFFPPSSLYYSYGDEHFYLQGKCLPLDVIWPHFFLHPLGSMSTCSLLLDLWIYTVVWHCWGQSGGWGACKGKCRIIEFWSWIKAPKVIRFIDKELSPRERRWQSSR